eukprot:TRINITY_DN366_c0_g1_i1.p1 TRINITY_DN366_c0_g1~~TRINITY_DN366_c0_g1_i1.p1  ORF type:complete len:1187 (-),score=476.65 TRINITY_DN366_c0_g1_i1:175-3735(-)
MEEISLREKSESASTTSNLIETTPCSPSLHSNSNKTTDNNNNYALETAEEIERLDHLVYKIAVNPSPKRIEELKEYYCENFQTRGVLLPPNTAQALLRALLESCALKKHVPGVKIPSKGAKSSLAALYFYLRNDSAFRRVMERKEAIDLIKLHLERHLKVHSESHKKTCLELLFFLALKFPKFSQWEDYIQGEETRELIKESPQYSSFLSSQSEEGSSAEAGSNYNDVDPQIVFSSLKTDPKLGLSSEEAAKRMAEYGPNSLPPPPPKPIWKMLWTQVTDFMVLILLAAAVLSFGISEYVSGAILVVVVVVNVLIGFVQDLKAERALSALTSLSAPTCTVLRNGEREIIDPSTLVPGDVVLIEEGNRVPADLRLFDVANLQIVEALLTGEPIPVDKITEPIKRKHLAVGDRKNQAFMSTVVVKGRGSGIVVTTGLLTEIGKISAELTVTKDPKTPLQKKLRKLGILLVIIAIVLCTLVVGIALARKYSAQKSLSGHDVLEVIEIGISLAVSVIPEGLVAVVTITMALGVQRMAKRKVIVRSLPIVETIGAVTTVCSDKTGTLTEGKMKTEELWTADGHSYTFSGPGSIPEGKMSFNEKELDRNSVLEKESLTRTLMASSLCNNSTIQFDNETKKWESFGDPTEVALQVSASKALLPKEYWTNDQGLHLVKEFAFDSDRKRMSVIYSSTVNSPLPFSLGSQNIVFAKGASESLSSLCTQVQYGDSVVPMDQSNLERISEKGNSMASKGLRVLALAYSLTPLSTVDLEEEGSISKIEKNLIFLGLCGLRDPPRKEVFNSIAQAKQAGIRVCMITGDHPKTAIAIAQDLGILEPNAILEGKGKAWLHGPEIEAMPLNRLSALDPFPTVFARVSPSDKLKIVRALKKRGEICAMTGDGVNDAPAIKNADVGIGMGESGTDLVKQSADIILLDDNFSSIVAGIEEGRRIFSNIQKFVVYLLSANSAEIYTMLGAVIIGMPVPFTAIMILWANLIADIPPAISLGIDPAHSTVLMVPPRDPKKGVFDRPSLFIVLFHGMSMAIITLSLYAIAIYVEHYDISTERNRARALAFVGLTCMQLAHAFCARAIQNTIFTSDLWSNKWLIGGVSVSLAFLVGASYIPGVQTLFHQWPLNWWDWIKILICVILHVAASEFMKLILRIFLNKRQARKTREKEAAPLIIPSSVSTPKVSV